MSTQLMNHRPGAIRCLAKMSYKTVYPGIRGVWQTRSVTERFLLILNGASLAQVGTVEKPATVNSKPATVNSIILLTANHLGGLENLERHTVPTHTGVLIARTTAT